MNSATAAHNAGTGSPLDPICARHDLMIELGCLEMAIDEARAQNQPTRIPALEQDRQKLARVLSRIPA